MCGAWRISSAPTPERANANSICDLRFVILWWNRESGFSITNYKSEIANLQTFSHMKIGFLDHGRRGRLFCCLLWLIAMLGIARQAEAANTTIVQDVVYRADGTPAAGTLVISFGSSGLSQAANNYFGIKARPGGESIDLPTTEYVNGVPVHGAAKFAKFASMGECFAERDRMITLFPAYAEARAAAQDPEAFVYALARHWATDPGYAEKVLSVYRAHALNRLDT